jgi:hypothetical protein
MPRPQAVPAFHELAAQIRSTTPAVIAMITTREKRDGLAIRRENPDDGRSARQDAAIAKPSMPQTVCAYLMQGSMAITLPWSTSIVSAPHLAVR